MKITIKDYIGKLTDNELKQVYTEGKQLFNKGWVDLDSFIHKVNRDLKQIYDVDFGITHVFNWCNEECAKRYFNKQEQKMTKLEKIVNEMKMYCGKINSCKGCAYKGLCIYISGFEIFKPTEEIIKELTDEENEL